MVVSKEDVSVEFVEDNAEFLARLADALDQVGRVDVDGWVIEDDGNSGQLEEYSVIQITDDLATQLSKRLREIAKQIREG